MQFRNDLTPHCTRHTFISKAKSKDVRMDEYILKLIVGHDINDITEHVYTHRELDELKEKQASVQPLVVQINNIIGCNVIQGDIHLNKEK